jgi:hypothetical protein
MNPLNPNKIELSFTQNFELEKIKRHIDSVTDVKGLQELAKSLASAWMSQRAATNWIIYQNMSPPSGNPLGNVTEPRTE